MKNRFKKMTIVGTGKKRTRNKKNNNIREKEKRE